MKLTKTQQDFLKAIKAGTPMVVSRRIVDALYEAGLIFPAQGNITFYIQGCKGHYASSFVAS